MAATELTRSTSAVLVIDVQNDFCDDEGVHGRRGSDLRWVQAVIEPIERLLETARRYGTPVIYVRTHHDRWSDHEKAYLRESRVGMLHHLEPGAHGSEFYRLRPGPDEYVVTKRRYSAFFGTELDIVLRNLGTQRVVLAGVATNVCVETTARDACMRDLDVVVVEECVAAYSEDAHNAALANIDRHFGRVVALDQVALDLAPPGGHAVMPIIRPGMR
ncbi:MAG: cysteine hydrolase family protein [Actinomycetes bacterium]